MIEFKYLVKSRLGIHTRVAAKLSTFLRDLDSEILIGNGNEYVKCGRLVALIELNIKQNEYVYFRIEGDKEDEERAKIVAYCEEHNV